MVTWNKAWEWTVLIPTYPGFGEHVITGCMEETDLPARFSDHGFRRFDQTSDKKSKLQESG